MTWIDDKLSIWKYMIALIWTQTDSTQKQLQCQQRHCNQLNQGVNSGITLNQGVLIQNGASDGDILDIEHHKMLRPGWAHRNYTTRCQHKNHYGNNILSRSSIVGEYIISWVQNPEWLKPLSSSFLLSFSPSPFLLLTSWGIALNRWIPSSWFSYG